VGGLLGTIANLGQTVTQLLGGPSTSNDGGGESQVSLLTSEHRFPSIYMCYLLPSVSSLLLLFLRSNSWKPQEGNADR
jgi:hypothetical protein